MQQLKWVEDMCVTCLFEDHNLSLLSTKHVAPRTNYNIDITQHKHTIQTQAIKATIEKGLFNNLDFSRYSDRRDMTIDWACKT